MATTNGQVNSPQPAPGIWLAELLIRALLSPLFIWLRAARDDAERQSRFQLCSECMSIWPFRIGMLARRVFYQCTLQRCGTNPIIRMGTIFIYPQTELGDNVLVGNHCVIGLATIGDDVMLAHQVSVLSGRRHHQRGADVPMRMQPSTVARIQIGDDVWLGAAAVVMADIGDHAIVGAGSVVVKPIPPGATVAGNPARLIEQPSPAFHN
jgi:virginiamycin A acetyltransferase